MGFVSVVVVFVSVVIELNLELIEWLGESRGEESRGDEMRFCCYVEFVGLCGVWGEWWSGGGGVFGFEFVIRGVFEIWEGVFGVLVVV